jgi:hypothetical protein
MSANIKSTLLDSPGGTPVGPVETGQSRDDLRKGYQVTLESVDLATTYLWELLFAPDSPNETSSSATLLPVPAIGDITVVDSTNITAGDTIFIDVAPLTATAAAATPGNDDFQFVPGDNATTAANIAAALNEPLNSFTALATGSPSGSQVAVTAVPPGAAGNAIALSVSLIVGGVITVTGLADGSAGTTSKRALFNVDFEGAYQVRLTVDKTLGTEDVQYVRMRALTRFGDLRLVSAGERRDGSGVIPVDIDAEGWANEQNLNMQRLAAHARRTTTSGRSLYVDANRGRDNSNTPNDPAVFVDLPGSDSADLATSGIQESAEGFADFSTITEAIDYALDYAARGEPAPSAEEPFTVYVQPGLYVEDLALEPHVHIVGLGATPFQMEVNEIGVTFHDDLRGGNHVIVRTANSGGATHEFSPSGDITEMVALENLLLENTDNATTEPVLKHTRGLLVLNRVAIEQKGTNVVTQGPAYGQITADIAAPIYCLAEDSQFRSQSNGADRYAVLVDAPLAQFTARGCRIIGSGGGMATNPSLYSTTASDTIWLDRCWVAGGGGGLALQGYSSLFLLQSSTIQHLTIDAFGAPPGSKTGDVSVTLRRTHIGSSFTFDIAGATGTTLLQMDFSSWVGALSFPNGAPTGTPVGHGYTVRYQNNWTDPAPPFGSAVPVPDQISATNVQDALDLLVNRTTPKLIVSINAAALFVVSANWEYIGVDTVTAAGIISLQLPDTEAGGAVDGRRITIKDEGGGCGVVGQQAGVFINGATSTIDGTVRAAGTPLVLNTNFQSVTLICRGAVGTTSTWFII